jgi:CRP-like cAMP-binding protein
MGFVTDFIFTQACRRTASARTSTISELCVLHKEDFEQILMVYPVISETLRKGVAEKKLADQRRKEEEERKKKLEEEEKRKEEALQALRLRMEKKPKRSKRGKRDLVLTEFSKQVSKALHLHSAAVDDSGSNINLPRREKRDLA